MPQDTTPSFDHSGEPLRVWVLGFGPCVCEPCASKPLHWGQESDKAISMTDKLERYLGTSLVFDAVKRVGPTTLHVTVWSFDPEVQQGFTIDCTLGVSP